MYVKKNLPEKDEFVICTIKQATPSSVFVTLDEFEKVDGMIHVSEIARKQVRAMKVYLKPGTKLVCKVMSVDASKRYVELSLRRVGEGQRRTKMQQWNREKIANDILEVFAKQMNISVKTAYDKVGNKLLEHYGALYPAFLELSNVGKPLLDKLGIEPKLAEALTALIKKRISLPKAKQSGNFIIQSFAENGLENVKSAIKLAKDIAEKFKSKLIVKYLSAPKYRFELESPNRKSLDDVLKALKEELPKFMATKEGTFTIELNV
jgi:translation initiation factor 2 subunit 1